MANQFELNERVTWTHNGVERPGMVSEVREDGKVYYVDMADNLSSVPVTVIALERELKFRPLFVVEDIVTVGVEADGSTLYMDTVSRDIWSGGAE